MGEALTIEQTPPPGAVPGVFKKIYIAHIQGEDDFTVHDAADSAFIEISLRQANGESANPVMHRVLAVELFITDGSVASRASSRLKAPYHDPVCLS